MMPPLVTVLSGMKATDPTQEPVDSGRLSGRMTRDLPSRQPPGPGPLPLDYAPAKLRPTGWRWAAAVRGAALFAAGGTAAGLAAGVVHTSGLVRIRPPPNDSPEDLALAAIGFVLIATFGAGVMLIMLAFRQARMGERFAGRRWAFPAAA